MEPFAPTASKLWNLRSSPNLLEPIRPAPVVFTNGCFDLLHPGHIAGLEAAPALGRCLIVGLNSDASVRANKGDGRPILNQHDRATMLAALACVDAVILFDEPTPENLIRQLSPDILVKGGDYTRDQIAGADHVEATGGRVIILPRDPAALSTSEIIRRCEIANHKSQIANAP